MSRKCDLLGVKRIIGHQIPKSAKKNKRKFLPNLSIVTLKSDILRKVLKLKITKRALRTVHKHGSLDGFLQNVNSSSMGEVALQLRSQIRKAIKKSKKV